MADLGIEGRAALVTGAARGIGLETARALEARGARVALLDLHAYQVEAAADSIAADTLAIAADVSDEAAVAGAVDACVTELGGLDIVVANAGIAQPTRPVSVLDPGEFDRVLAVNLDGVVHTVRQALPHVIEAGGHAQLIASVMAFVNGALASSYAMSKAAVEQLGRALRVELAPHGASAGVAYFGYVDTAMVAGVQQDPIAKHLQAVAPRPLRKRIAPRVAGEALAEAIEHRAPRTIRPRRWALYSRLRGLLNPMLDESAVRSGRVREAIVAAERIGTDSG